VLASLYAIGAFGIMTLNDFKAITGDKEMGIKSLPVVIGEHSAVRVACTVMIIPQLLVIIFLLYWNLQSYGLIIAGSLLLQIIAMIRLIRNPTKYAPWYNATGVTLYVLGMMVSAIAISSRLL
jgi:chlorophyll synthase